MNKKIFLFFVLSLINNNLLYGDNTEKIIRKNDTIFRMVDNKLIKLDNAAITIKLREGKVLSKNVKTIRSNKLVLVIGTGTWVMLSVPRCPPATIPPNP